MRLRIILTAILVVVTMVGIAYTEQKCALTGATIGWKRYDDIKKHILALLNGESDTPIIHDGLEDKRCVRVYGPVRLIEEMNFNGFKIWMFEDRNGLTLYSWKRLGFECHRTAEDIMQEIIQAANEGQFEKAKRLLNERGNVNAKDKEGMTALIWAARTGQQQVVRLLLDRGANVNDKDKAGCTALMYASSKGYFAVVKALVGKRADVNAKDAHGWTALKNASGNGHAEVMMFLKANGAKE